MAQYSSKEQKIGLDMYESVKSEKGFYKNNILQAWIEHIGRSVEIQIPEHYDFQYFLVDDPSPNAFATAGGYVFVNRGLLVYVNTPDELAGILAHEITHVTKHHILQRTNARILPNILKLPGKFIGLLTYKKAGEVINAPIEAAADVITSATHRTQEFEADKTSIDLTIKAGYNPYALMDILKRLDRLKNKNQHTSYFKSLVQDHPLTDDRVADMENQLFYLAAKKPAKSSGTYLSFLDGLHLGQNPEAGLINGTTFIHPTLELACDFPEGWVVHNSSVSLIATSPNKKSTIILSMESSSLSPFQASVYSLNKLQKSDILESGPGSINGLNTYQASVKDKRIKYADQLYEFLWVKIPSTNALIKVVGISPLHHVNPEISYFFDTFRLPSAYDKSDIQYPVIKLKYAKSKELFEEFINRNNLEWQMEMLQNINNIEPNDTISHSKYLKTIIYEGLD